MSTKELQPETTRRPLPPGWRWVRLGEVCTAIRGVTFPSAEASLSEFVNSIACLTTSGVQDKPAWETCRFISTKFLSSRDQILRVGDILVSTANSKELVGKSCLVSDTPFECTFGTFVTVLRPNDNIDAAFLHSVMRRRETLDFCYQYSSNTTGISNLRVSDLLSLEIPLPPLSEQKRIAGILREQMAAVERARRAAEEQLEAINKLPAALLRKAFAGEL